MEISDNMEWLQWDKGARRVFVAIAGREKTTLREIKEGQHFNNWWPVKHYIKGLKTRGLIDGDDKNRIYYLTPEGEKLWKTMETIQTVKLV
jgi:hypothetical protein